MLFRWLRSRRRQRIQSQPFPADWLEILESDVALYRSLPMAMQSELRGLVQVFVAEKNWEGVNGFVVDDRAKVIIAALACVLIVGRPRELRFDHVLSILVYPDVFLARKSQTTPAGVVIEGREARSGEAWYRGPVILSWEDVIADARREDRGYNVVLHEFAHQLDMLGGHIVDGTPPMRNRQEYDRWSAVMEREFEALRERCRRREFGVIDCYGTQNPAEFFAVTTEAFFERPRALLRFAPELFDLLKEFYALDPLTWRAGGAVNADAVG